MKEENRRSAWTRTYFIDKKFQSRFILKFCLTIFLGGLLTIGMLYYFSSQSTTVSVVNSRVAVRSTSEFLLPILIQTVAVVMGLISLAAIILTLVVSHKISGPAYRFKKTMELLGLGDYSSDCRIRKLDQMQELAEAINLMIRKQRQQINAFRDHAFRLKDKLNSIEEHEVSEHKRVSLKELKSLSEELEKIVKYYKT